MNKDAEFNSIVDKDNIVHLIMKGHVTKESIPDMKKWTEESIKMTQDLSEKTGGRVLVLMDLSELTEIDYQLEALDALGSLARNTEAFIFKTAMFGAEGAAKFGYDIVVHFTGLKNIRDFKTKEEALVWLLTASEK